MCIYHQRLEEPSVWQIAYDKVKASPFDVSSIVSDVTVAKRHFRPPHELLTDVFIRITKLYDSTGSEVLRLISAIICVVS